MLFIAEMGSGNTCKNDIFYCRKMLNALKAVDTGKNKIVIKWQLFQAAGDNIPLQRKVFDQSYNDASSMGYECTASVFDLDSLYFLMTNYKVPFIKIANNKALYDLIKHIPRRIPVYYSVNGKDQPDGIGLSDKSLCCVSDYPANVADYTSRFTPEQLKAGLSDHTKNLKLFKQIQPEIWERHIKLDDSTGLDAGDFASTPEQLKDIL
jgi:sialic acid synthase SpsE